MCLSQGALNSNPLWERSQGGQLRDPSRAPQVVLGTNTSFLDKCRSSCLCGLHPFLL